MSSTRSPGQRAGLSRNTVIEAAREIADHDGLEHLSMRSLASALGVRPNALYSHVAGKDELLDGLLDHVLGQIETPAAGPWRESLVTVLDSTRRVLVEHPRLIQAFLTRPTRGPNAMRLGEVCLDLLAEAGMEGERAVRGFRSLLIFALGYAAYEAPRAADPDPAARMAASAESFRAAGHPRSTAAADDLAALPGDTDFHAGLGWMLDGLLAQSEAQAK